MRRRWSRASVPLLFCLIVAIVAGMTSHGFARDIKEKRAKELAVGLLSIGLRRCKRSKMEHCGYNHGKNSSSLVDDEKRVVPTGPNPLHNR